MKVGKVLHLYTCSTVQSEGTFKMIDSGGETMYLCACVAKLTLKDGGHNTEICRPSMEVVLKMALSQN